MNISSGLSKNKNSSSLRQLHTCEFRVSGRKSQVQSESFRGFLLEVRAETFWLFEKKQRRNGKNWSSLPDGVQRPVKARLIFIYWFTQSAQEAFLSPHLFVRLSPAVVKIRSLLRIETWPSYRPQFFWSPTWWGAELRPGESAADSLTRRDPTNLTVPTGQVCTTSIFDTDRLRWF